MSPVCTLAGNSEHGSNFGKCIRFAQDRIIAVLWNRLMPCCGKDDPNPVMVLAGPVRQLVAGHVTDALNVTHQSGYDCRQFLKNIHRLSCRCRFHDREAEFLQKFGRNITLNGLTLNKQDGPPIRHSDLHRKMPTGC